MGKESKEFSTLRLVTYFDNADSQQEIYTSIQVRVWYWPFWSEVGRSRTIENAFCKQHARRVESE